MTTVRGGRLSKSARGVAHAHEWEMIASFMLRLAEKGAVRTVELLAPVADALEPYGLEEDQMLAISAVVERVGEELRGCCPDGRLDCISVRVHMSAAALARSSANHRVWDFFVVKNIASSESDNLDMFDNPRCYIDVHVFQE